MKITNGFITALLFLCLAQTMAATNIVGSKYLIASLPILFLLTIRFSIACLLLLPLHWFTAGRKNNLQVYLKLLTKKDWLFIFSQAISAGVLFNLLMLLGLHYTDANIAGIVTSALPAMIAIMAWITLREKLTAKKIFCIFFATLGLLVISIDKFHSVNAHSSLIGALLVFIALLPEATYYVLSKMHHNRLPVFLVSAIINGINALILWPLLLLFINIPALNISAFMWLILIIVGMTSGLFYTFWFLSAHKVDATLASLSTAVMPVATVLIAWWALGETINIAELIGMLLVITSIIIYALGSNP